MNFNKTRAVVDNYGNLVNVANIVSINELFGLQSYYVATDEYNMLYFKCWQSSRFICESDLMVVGGNIPNTNCKFPMHKESILMYKDSCKLFEMSEANCNTCKFLQRIKHEKSTDGFLKGKCTKKGIDLKFHPNDPMWHIKNEERKIIKSKFNGLKVSELTGLTDKELGVFITKYKSSLVNYQSFILDNSQETIDNSILVFFNSLGENT